MNDSKPGQSTCHFRIAEVIWRPAGTIYLAAMLIALAVGLWPGSITGSVDPYWPASVPAVQTLTVAQAGFYLLAYPLIVLFRSRGGAGWRLWPDAIVEMLFWTAVSGAFYVPAVWLSGSKPIDAICATVYVMSLWPMVWVCGAWLASSRGSAAVVLLVSIIIAIGLPWLWYVSAEFFGGLGWSDVLWRLCPLTQAWDVSAPGGRSGGLEPVWAVLVWPITATLMFAIRLVCCTKQRGQDSFCKKES